MFDVINSNLKQFSGNGFLFLLLIFGVIYLAFSLKKGITRVMLMWFPMYALLIYFCPLWNVYMSLREDGEILYRILWLIPFSVIVCYALVDIIGTFPKRRRVLAFSLSVLLIMFSGKYVYSNEFFSKAENAYHVPKALVRICDEIEVPGREVMACMPIEFIQYSRQYSPFVCMIYGRDTLLWGGQADFSDIMELLQEDVYDTDAIVEKLREKESAYFITRDTTKFTKPMEDYEYTLVKNIDGYDIYLDNHAYLGLDF